MQKRYSLRKLRTGKLVLALVGAIMTVSGVVSSPMMVSAEEQVTASLQLPTQEKSVKLISLLESDLTESQKQALVKFDHQKVEKDDSVYYYVYRPQDTSNSPVLPNTGVTDNLIGVLAGVSLIVVAIAVSKNKKNRRILSVTLVTLGVGGVLSSTAVAQEWIGNFVEEVSVSVGDGIPVPKALEGYEFTGYFIREKSTIKGNPTQPLIKKGEPATEEALPEAKMTSTSTEKEVPFKEVVREDSDLEEGTTTVIQEGEVGYVKKRIDQITVNGQEVDTRETVIDTKEAKDKIIVKGTKKIVTDNGEPATEEALPEAKMTSTSTEKEVPFKEVVREDSDLEEGTTTVIQEGEAGYVKKRIDQITVNGQVVDTRETVMDTKEAKDKIIVKGTKKATPVKTDKGEPATEEALPEAKMTSTTTEEEVPFKEVVREDSDLEEGTTTVIQEGEAGYVKKRIDKISVNGQEVDTRETVMDTKEAKDKIIVKGTKKATPVKTDKGEPATEEALPEAIVTSATTQEDVPFKEVVREDSDLEEGKTKVIQEGEAGYVKKRIDKISVNGQEVDTRETVIDTKEAKDKIIVKGTKKIVTDKGEPATEEVLPEAIVTSTTTQEDVPFKEVVREDSDLEEGKTKVIQEGEAGYVKKRIDKISVNGQEVDTRETVIDTKEAKDKIIVKGTKKIVTDKGNPVTEEALPEAIVTSTTTQEDVPFKEVVREDSDLEEGKTKVIQEGEAGYVKKRIDKITVNGQVVDTRETVIDTKDAKDKIIVKGTKKIVTDKGEPATEEALPEAIVTSATTQEDVPFKEVVREDSDLEEGKTKVIQEGEAGYVKKRIDKITVNGQVVDTRETVIDIKDAKDKIIVKGTKKIVTDKGEPATEEALPEAKISSTFFEVLHSFQTIYRPDSELEEGKTKIIRNGEKGYQKQQVDKITVNGEVVDTRETIVSYREPISQIVLVGTKKPTPVPAGHVIKFTNVYYQDPNKKPAVPTWEYINSLPNSEKEKIQAQTPDYAEDPEYRKEVVKLFREMFNYKAFNESFLKIINAERASKNIAPLQLDDTLIAAAQIRANEQGDIAQSLRTNGKPHTRPYSGDRSQWQSVFEEVGTPEWRESLSSLGENLLETTSYSTDVAAMLNYDLVAKGMFEQWKKSPGHYANMMSTDYTHLGLGVAQTLFSKTSNLQSMGSAVGSTLFASYF